MGCAGQMSDSAGTVTALATVLVSDPGPGPVGSVVTTVAAVATGLTAGVYLAFSVLVMPALPAAGTRPAVALMQRVNRLAERPVFGIVFAAAALGSAWILVAPWFTGDGRSAAATAGAALSFAAFVITMTVNVPRNRRLAAIDGSIPAELAGWPAIARPWCRANHLRAGCATLGLIAFLL